MVVGVRVDKIESELNRSVKTPVVEPLKVATTRIINESRGAPLPPIEAATLIANNSSHPVGKNLTNLPAGYVVVDFSGEMTLSPIRDFKNQSHFDDSGIDKLDWIESSDVDSLDVLAMGTGRGSSFGWLKLEEGARRSELENALKELDTHVVGGSGWMLRVQLPDDHVRLDAVTRLPGVGGIGVIPVEEKLRAFDSWPYPMVDHEPTPVFVTLMDDDVDGRWGREIESLNVTVGRYDPQIRVYTANVTRKSLQVLAAKDFVLSIEPIGIVQAVHDTSIPAMGADALRKWISTGWFSGIGGASVPIGVMDSGLNIRHADIGQNRASICGSNFVWSDPRKQDEDLWIDTNGHGTHVTGTLLGNGFYAGAFAGMAPSVQHVRFAKVLNSQGRGSTDSVLRAMDWLTTRSGCEDSDEVSPNVVNMSLSASELHFEGRDVASRKLDAVVWHSNQLYVVAQSNEGTSGFSQYGAAKNSLAVGAVYDDGNHAAFSSHGPTADGRLAPQVVATGVDICSTRGNGVASGYICAAGTSMASPTVAGAAVLLMDASSDYAGRPALVRSRLMASAVRPDAWFEDSDAFALDNSVGPSRLQERYGLGKVSARAAVLEREASDGWSGGGATTEFDDDRMYAYEDIIVPENASRLDVVMTWDEPPVDAVFGSVLNDLDLWLDSEADCEGGPCGERASTSRVDNVEWVIVRNPAPGRWRLKIVGERLYTGVKAALAWNVIRGASTPRLSVDLEELNEHIASDNSRQVNIDLSATVDSYLASGVTLHFECRGASDDCGDSSLDIVARDVMREDGLRTVAGKGDADEPRHRSPHIELGQKIPLGEIAVGESQAVELEVNYSGAKPVRLHYTVSAWNARGVSGSVVISPSENTRTDEISLAQISQNDAFKDATIVERSEGSTTVDLAGSTSEPGEPQASTVAAAYIKTENRWHERPLGSLWYRWTAPANGLATFWLVSQESEQRSEALEVFKGSALAAAIPIASNQRGNVEPIYSSGLLVGELQTISTLGSLAFFAEQGESYRIRVSNSEETNGSMTLRWYQGERPANDDFVSAIKMTGTSGEVEGTNVGATLETGESFGLLAGTTWYRWVAPSDDAWTFSVDRHHLRVAVFTGEQVHDLRLVSGYPATEATFRGQSEQVYRIAVAVADAFVTGEPYTLSWETIDWDQTGDDDFSDRSTFTRVSGTLIWTLGQRSTVEPKEPPETGVRTLWWGWEAPESGYYTWRLEETDFSELTMAVFAGESLDNLSLAASTEPPVTGRELSFWADGETAYVFSLGWPKGDFSAYTSPQARGKVGWGITPDNDERTSALTLGSTRGSTHANDRYGTTGVGELDDLLGHSSLWWKWEAPTDGWYSFNASGRYIAVYSEGSTTPLAQQWFVNGQVTLRALKGATYAIRVGSPVFKDGGIYRLYWGPVRTPAWLRYVGAVTENVDSRGAEFPLLNPEALAIADEGDFVFAVSDYGLEVFQRDATSGTLVPSQRIDGDLFGSAIAWDPNRNRLLATRCDDWTTFVQDGSAFAQSNIEITDDPGNCGNKIVTTHDGVSVYKTGNAGLDHYEVHNDGHLRYMHTSSGIRDAEVNADSSRLYTISDFVLREFKRDVATGSLEATSRVSTQGESLDLDSTGDWLFAVDELSGDVNVYKLRPTLTRFGTVDSENPVFDPSSHDPYRYVSARSATAADVFGDSVVLSLHSERKELTDAIGEGLDRFTNPVPIFGVPNGLAASADGRHLYISTDLHGILLFERIGQGVELMDPHTRLDLIEIAGGSVTFGTIEGSDCIDVSDLVIDDIHYTVRESKWQWRPNEDWSWTDLPNTTVSGQLCPYTPDKPGQYRLVAEMDVAGETKWHSSNKVIQDDHQDSLDDATVVDVPSSTLGWLYIDDDDFFRIEVTEFGTLTTYTEGWIDTRGSLLNHDGDIIASDDNDGVDRNFHISRDLNPGTYYVRVRGAVRTTGEYRLNVEFKVPPPDLVIENAELGGTPTLGEEFTLSAWVRNLGKGRAEATMLRFYRSDDSSITFSDDEIGTAEVGELMGGEISKHSIEVSVEEEGTYSYGACVDAVDGEESTTNNCSSAAREPSDITSFDLDPRNGNATGVTSVGSLLYVADWIDDKVYVYTVSGERRSASDFDQDEETQWAQSITQVGSLLFVGVYFSDSPNKVYAYTHSGERRSDSDFELERRAPWWPDGMVYAADTIYIADNISSEIYAYTTSGDRLPDSGFDLERENSNPKGIAYDGSLLYVVDQLDDKVYAYTLSGEHHPDSDFDLQTDNRTAEGITYLDGRFYVIDETQDKVYVYRDEMSN